MKLAGDYWVPDVEELQLDALTAGGWQLERLEKALKYVKEWRIAIDVGAHVGSWTRVLAERFKEVWAFEPAPDTFACLRKNVTAPNVELSQLALGDSCKRIGMLDDERFGSRNTGGRHLSGDGDVGMITLDQLNIFPVDFIKLDVEGFEPMVIEGARETLTRWKPVIIVEDKARMARRYGYAPGLARQMLEMLGATEVNHIGDDHIFLWR